MTWPPWHTYTDHLQEMLHHMNTDDTFADVTLVCDDGRQIRAHKVVLGASSPILKNMLITEDTSIIVLKGVALEEMNSILQFIYLDLVFDQISILYVQMFSVVCLFVVIKLKNSC